MNARLAGAVALAALAAAAPTGANAAALYHVVYNATITDGVDTDNLFGLLGNSLAGLGMSADVTYSTSVPGTRTTSAVDDEVMGGDAFFTDPVISSAVFTVGTKSVGFAPSYYGDVYTSATFLNAYGYDTLGNSFQAFIQPMMTGPRNLQTPFSSPGAGDPGGAATQYSFVSIGADLIDFNATSVTVSAVPEPATWTAMLAGFGAMGAAMRRRGKRRAPAMA